MFGLSRVEGERVKNETTLRKLMPYLMPRRNDSAVYFEQTIDVTNALAYLKERKDQGATPNLTFFHLVLAGMARAASKWPKMNRFVVGSKLYQRKHPVLSFAVKKRMDKDAGMTAVKEEFEETNTVFDVAQKIDKHIAVGRGEKLTSSEKEMVLVNYLPGFVIRFILWLQRFLDGANLLPSVMTKNDPLYTGIFIANLGSVGLHAPFHHLYEYGTAPLFAVIGKIYKAAMVNDEGQVVARDVVLIRYTFDERIADGFYCAQALQLFEQYMLNPKRLETSEG